MMRCGKYRIAGILISIVIWCGTARLHSQTEADWRWTEQEFGPILDALMPLQQDGGLHVSYRANKDLYTSTPEYWFSVGLEPDEKQAGSRNFFSAHVRVAQPTSIYDQIMAIHRAEPATSDMVTVRNRVKLEKADLTEMNCPAIKTQMEKLKSLTPKLPDITGNYIVLHPMIHSFYISGADGRMTVSLTNEKNPLVQWAEETRQVLDHCRMPQ